MSLAAAAAEKGRPSSSSSTPAVIASSELDPLLKDLSEKKQSFSRRFVSPAAELKDVRSRLASQEESFASETLSRQLAEKRVNTMKEEICRLQRNQEEDGQLQAYLSSAEQYLKDLENLRSELSVTQAAAEASATSARSAETKCFFLLRELDEKNILLKEYEDRVNRLGEQLNILLTDLQARELSQNQLEDEVFRIEKEIIQAVAQAGPTRIVGLKRSWWRFPLKTLRPLISI